jgi:hypothetical protein
MSKSGVEQSTVIDMKLWARAQGLCDLAWLVNRKRYSVSEWYHEELELKRKIAEKYPNGRTAKVLREKVGWKP